jgi:hypothetical protein
MGDYSDHKNVQTIHHINSSQNVDIDVNALADAIAKKMPKFKTNTGAELEDDFNNEATLDKLARAMVVQKDTDANLKNIGDVRLSKKDVQETQKTIDLLSNLD